MKRKQKQTKDLKSIPIKNIYVLGLIDSVALSYQSKIQTKYPICKYNVIGLFYSIYLYVIIVQIRQNIHKCILKTMNISEISLTLYHVICR